MNQLSRKPLGIRRRQRAAFWPLSGLLSLLFWNMVMPISTASAAVPSATDLENPACTQDTQVIAVPSGDVAALIVALNTANRHPEGTLINLEAGVYTLTEADNSLGVENDNGLPIIVSPICIQGAGAANTIIERTDAADDFRLFYVASGGVLTLNAVTLRGGRLWGSDGGGLFNDHGGSVILSHSVITRCGVGTAGGSGIFNRGTMRIIQSTLSHHRQGDGSGGGGIYNAAEMAISQSTIADNSVGEGGGGGIGNSSNMIVTQSTIANNRGDFNGGGIANSGKMTIVNSTIANNRADGDFTSGFGGGIANGGELLIIQSTLSGNRVFDGFDDDGIPRILGGKRDPTGKVELLAVRRGHQTNRPAVR